MTRHNFLDETHRGPFHKSSYERCLLYEFVKPVLNYGFNEFVAFTNFCETGPRSLLHTYDIIYILLNFPLYCFMVSRYNLFPCLFSPMRYIDMHDFTFKY